MPRRSFVALLALTFLPFACAPTPAAPLSQHVFIVSFDGGKPAAMKLSKMPTLFEMVKQGAASWNAQTVKPSITLVSHVSMLTGVQPAKHQISWNEWKPERGLVKVPTVFKLARENGYTTGLFAGKDKFRHLNIPGTVDEFQVPAYSAKVVAAAAAKYIVTAKPSLCFIHFADSDGAGHAYGWGSPEQLLAFANEDAALKVLRDAVREAGIEKTSTFILTADHGGHDRTHGTDDPQDMTIPWLAWGAGIKPKTKITVPVSTCDTAATALWLLGVAVPEGWDGKPVMSGLVAR